MLVKDKAASDADLVLAATWQAGLPIDPERIASALSITVDRVRMNDEISGMLRVDPGFDPEIFVEATDSRQRQRFTIAHEIGHFVERKNSGETDFNFIDRRGGGYDAHELYADEFAGNLLMPRREVQRLHAEGKSTIDMALRFDVSAQAMQIRLRRLGLA